MNAANIPWTMKPETETLPAYIYESNGHEAAVCYGNSGTEIAAFIVKAVNNFEAMREALKGMLQIQDSVTQGQERELKAEWIPKARALLTSLERSEA